MKENSAASHFLQINPGEKERKLDFELENRGRLIDGEIQNTWLLLHPWPIGQDTLDIDSEKRVLKEKKELGTLVCKSSLG